MAQSIDWLIDWPSRWLIDWVAVCSIDWLILSLFNKAPSLYFVVQVISQQRSNRDDHIRSLYDRFQIKQSIKNGNTETYGCSKTTLRCFGNVVNETPSYLYEGRWTPPCCVNALKATLQHVIEVFDFNNVAYWLEGGSLLGAARNGQLIPWDYDIDIGMFLNDTNSIQYLQAAADGPVVRINKTFHLLSFLRFHFQIFHQFFPIDQVKFSSAIHFFIKSHIFLKF